MSYLVFLTRSNLQILGKTQTGISDFWISGQSFIIENYHNSGTIHDNMKLAPKLDKWNTATSKKNLGNCDIIVFFPIYGQIAASWKPDSKRMISKSYIFINSKPFILQNLEKKSLTQLSYYCIKWRYYFCQKILNFCKKMLTSAKMRKSWF